MSVDNADFTVPPVVSQLAALERWLTDAFSTDGPPPPDERLAAWRQMLNAADRARSALRELAIEVRQAGGAPPPVPWPADPFAVEEVEAAAAELELESQSESPPESGSAEPIVESKPVEPPPRPEELFRQRLATVWTDDGSYEMYAAALLPDPDGATYAELWRALHLADLRVPGTRQVGAGAVAALAAAQEEYAEVAGEQAAWQLDLAPEPLADEKLVGLLPETIDPARRQLLDFAAQVSWLLENDRTLRHGLADLPSGELQEVDGLVQRSHRAYLEGALENLAKAEPGSAEEFDALLRIDELLRGVVPVPLPAQESWWMNQLDHSLQLLIDHPGGTMVRPPDVPRPYRPAFTGTNWSSGELLMRVRKEQVHLMKPVSDKPGDVVWILRLPSKGKPGRVVQIPSGLR
ncbi:hypothetical protein GCM10022251_16570 [Phytohabitans flavus]|uniref:Uncharacterized protein n=1 Tax=Phytohabitans flavus TaxID=1076124 RepID=A0A6F8Y6E5_9ACTN|nr:hypothetical protein [Phytohabitans flavus]BCB81593.1 hypothetical protein Pflav_080030 [Phytohabitans flavus]